MDEQLAYLLKLEEELKKVEEIVHEIEAPLPVIQLKSASTLNETFLFPELKNHEVVNGTWTCEAKHHTCIRFFEEFKTWNEAQKHCHLHRSHLARIYDPNYLNFLDHFRDEQSFRNGFNSSAYPEETEIPNSMKPLSAYSEFWVYYNDRTRDSEGNYRINRWNIDDGSNSTIAELFRKRREADEDVDPEDLYPGDDFLQDGTKGNDFPWKDIDEDGMWAEDDPNSLADNSDDCVFLNKELKLGDSRCDSDEKYFICQTLPRDSIFHVYHQVYSEECDYDDETCNFFKLDDIRDLRNGRRCATVDSDDCFLYKGPGANAGRRHNEATSWLNMKPFRYLENQEGLYYKMQWTPGFELTCEARNYDCVKKKHGHFITWYQEHNPFTNMTSPDGDLTDEEYEAIKRERAGIFPEDVTFFPGENFPEIFGTNFSECDKLAFNGLGFGLDDSSLFTGLLDLEAFYQAPVLFYDFKKKILQLGATKAFRVENEKVRGETLFGLSHIATIFGDGCEEESRKRRAVDNVYNWGLPVHGIDLWISKAPFPSSGNMKCKSEYESGDQFRQTMRNNSNWEGLLAYTCITPPPPKFSPTLPPITTPPPNNLVGETLAAAGGGALGGSVLGTLGIKGAPAVKTKAQAAAKAFALWINKKLFAMPEMKTKSTAYHPTPKKPNSNARTQYLDPALLAEEIMMKKGFKKYENPEEIEIKEEIAESEDEDSNFEEYSSDNEFEEEEDGRPLLRDFSTNLDLLDYVDFHDWEDDSDEMENRKVYVDVADIEEVSKIANELSEMDRACGLRAELIHEYDGELVEEGQTLMYYLADKSKTFKEILAKIEETNSVEVESPANAAREKLLKKYPGLTITRSYEKSTSTPVELEKALKKTATKIADPLQANADKLMKTASAMASKELKKMGNSLLKKLSVELVKAVNEKLLPKAELDKLNFENILFPKEKFDATITAYMYPDKTTQPNKYNPELPGFWTSKKMNTSEDLRTHFVKPKPVEDSDKPDESKNDKLPV